MKIKLLVALIVLFGSDGIAGECELLLEPENPAPDQEVVANWQDVLSCISDPVVSVTGSTVQIDFNFSGCNQFPPGACQNHRVPIGTFSPGHYEVVAVGLGRQRVAHFSVGGFQVPAISSAGILTMVFLLLAFGAVAHRLTRRSSRPQSGASARAGARSPAAA